MRPRVAGTRMATRATEMMRMTVIVAVYTSASLASRSAPRERKARNAPPRSNAVFSPAARARASLHVLGDQGLLSRLERAGGELDEQIAARNDNDRRCTCQKPQAGKDRDRKDRDEPASVDPISEPVADFARGWTTSAAPRPTNEIKPMVDAGSAPDATLTGNTRTVMPSNRKASGIHRTLIPRASRRVTSSTLDFDSAVASGRNQGV